MSQIVAEGGKLEEALKLLDESKDKVCVFIKHVIMEVVKNMIIITSFAHGLLLLLHSGCGCF